MSTKSCGSLEETHIVIIVPVTVGHARPRDTYFDPINDRMKTLFVRFRVFSRQVQKYFSFSQYQLGK